MKNLIITVKGIMSLEAIKYKIDAYILTIYQNKYRYCEAGFLPSSGNLIHKI
jgi:hypothetical protein